MLEIGFLKILQKGLPLAFEIANKEFPKGNPAVGLIRGNVLISFLANRLEKTLLNRGS